jgi:hypothetical protein
LWTTNLSVGSETPRRTSLCSETQDRPAGAFSITRFEGMKITTREASVTEAAGETTSFKPHYRNARHNSCCGGRACPEMASGVYSRRIWCACLSSRSPTNRACLRCPSVVHSTNSNWPTSSGFSQRHSFIFSAVSPCPQRPLLASGRFANGRVAGDCAAGAAEDQRRELNSHLSGPAGSRNDRRVPPAQLYADFSTSLRWLGALPAQAAAIPPLLLRCSSGLSKIEQPFSLAMPIRADSATVHPTTSAMRCFTCAV